MASPLDESALFRLIRLLDQFKRLNTVDYETKMGGFADLPTVQATPQPQEMASSEPQPSSDTPHQRLETPLAAQHSGAGETRSWQEKLDY